MKSFVSFFLIFFVNNALGVGWEEVLPSEMEGKGISIKSEFRKFSSCTSFEIELPTSIYFKDLGNRKFHSARYVGMQDETVTFPLSGTTIGLQSIHEKDVIELKGVCVSNKDLDRAYISASYIGSQGSVPMVVYFRLKSN